MGDLARAEAEDRVREYVGRDLYAIGEHIEDGSCYNHNYYRLPNGAVVLLSNDDDGFNMVYVVNDDGREVYVGAQYDDGEFMLGNY